MRTSTMYRQVGSAGRLRRGMDEYTALVCTLMGQYRDVVLARRRVCCSLPSSVVRQRDQQVGVGLNLVQNLKHSSRGPGARYPRR